MSKKEKIIHALKKNGLKLTGQRLAIIDTMVLNQRPMSAKDIRKKIAKPIDLATVYRNLETLKGIGIVFEENNNGRRSFYYSEDHHHHIRCIRCGKVDCIPCDFELKDISGYTDIDHELTFTGICDDCRERKENA